MRTSGAKPFVTSFAAGLLAAYAPLGAAMALPTVELHRSETTVAPGESYFVTATVTWNGGPDEFTVQPVDVNPIDWGSVKVVTAQGRSENGRHTVEQTVEIIANEPGDYVVPEFRIGLSDPEATVPSEAPDARTTLPDPGAYPMLKTDPFPLRVRSDRSLVWVSGGLGALLLLVAVAGGSAALRRRRSGPDSSSPPFASTVELSLVHARRCRDAGDFYGFYLSLHEAATLAAAPPSLTNRLAERAQGAGYRGYVPTPDDAEGDLRDIQRALKLRKKEEAPL